MPIIRLADGFVERLVLDVIEPAAVQRARGNWLGISVSDELGERRLRLVHVDNRGHGLIS